jgi:hypothetical protein
MSNTDARKKRKAGPRFARAWNATARTRNISPYCRCEKVRIFAFYLGGQQERSFGAK